MPQIVVPGPVVVPANHKFWPPNNEVVEFILSEFDPGYVGYAIDVGASDGFSINSTYTLEIKDRWTVVSVEANPGFAQILRATRARVEMCACSDQPGEAVFSINTLNPEAFSSLKPRVPKELLPEGGVSFETVKVPVKTVDQILAAWEFPRLDVLCVDTEGTELDVLKGCDLARWNPKVIVTECWEKTGPIDEYLESFGYAKMARSCYNDIWVGLPGDSSNLLPGGKELELVRSYLPLERRQYAVELGAGDGVLLSNTLWFERAGGDVLCIEPHPRLFEDLCVNRKRAVRAACSDHDAEDADLLVYFVPGGAHYQVAPMIEPVSEEFRYTYMADKEQVTAVAKTPVRTLDRLLTEAGFPRLDYLSLDVDGIEMKVLAGFDIKWWNPAVVLIENPFDSQEMATWFLDRGYRRAEIGGVRGNDIWIPK